MALTAACAGISGGRTSGMMAFLLDPSVILTFQNTGEEHEKTLEFLRRLEDDLGRPIVRLEYRAPPRGEEPKHSTFEVMTHERLSRRGEPFLVGIEQTYGPMRRQRALYTQVLLEAPERMRIRAELAAGREVTESFLPKHRLRLIVAQEKEPKSAPWSCSCEGAEMLADEIDAA